MLVDALKTYLETQIENCKYLKFPIETCFEGETIISVFIEDDKVQYATECHGFLFQTDVNELLASDIIEHLWDTENIFIPVDD